MEIEPRQTAYERAVAFLDRAVEEVVTFDEKTERRLLIEAKLARRSEIAVELRRLQHEHDLLSGEIYVLECEDLRERRNPAEDCD